MNDERYSLFIQVRISDRQFGGSGLQVEESIELGAPDFFEMSEVLGQFHKLAKEIEAKRKK